MDQKFEKAELVELWQQVEGRLLQEAEFVQVLGRLKARSVQLVGLIEQGQADFVQALEEPLGQVLAQEVLAQVRELNQEFDLVEQTIGLLVDSPLAKDYQLGAVLG
jgi:hypothetical protein